MEYNINDIYGKIFIHTNSKLDIFYKIKYLTDTTSLLISMNKQAFMCNKQVYHNSVIIDFFNLKYFKFI